MPTKSSIRIILLKIFPKIQQRLFSETFANPILELIEERQLMKLITTLATRLVYFNIVLYGLISLWNFYQTISFLWFVIPSGIFVGLFSLMFILAVKMGKIDNILNDTENTINKDTKTLLITSSTIVIPLVLIFVLLIVFFGFDIILHNIT